MTTDRPSIAELQGTTLPLVRHPDWVGQAAWEDARDTLVDAAPVLLEITAAALAWQECRREWQLRQTFSLRSKLDHLGDELEFKLSRVAP